MTIGVIFCGYNAAEYLEMSLTPWMHARNVQLGGHRYLICGVSCPFESFDHGGVVDDTTERLEQHRAHNGIDALITSNRPIKETQARGDALRWLVAHDAEMVWQVDLDEQYTEKDIERITSFVASRPLVPWFKMSLRNAVFTKDQYLTEPFCPPRIHRIEPRHLTAHSFWDDNNILYRSGDGTYVRDIDLPHLTIPKTVVWPRHYSWLSDLRSKRKIEYQRIRWGQSSFRWDEQHGLCFDESYYASKSLPLPEVARD